MHEERELRKTLETLTRVLRETAQGRCAIALAGAHAKGAADAGSDIDLYLYAEGARPLDERRRVLEAVADGEPYLDEDFESTPWGGAMDFSFHGTPVEVAARTFALTDRRVRECLDGRFEIIPAAWTSNGYYSFIHLAELSFIRPIYDPDGILAGYQKKARPYPEKLRRSIARTFFERAGTWIDNFHYESAIRRLDTWFCGPIVMHTVMDMTQVIFALNGAYFTGDKKLVRALRGLPYCPAALLEHSALLMGAPEDEKTLLFQREVLRAVHAELAGRLRAEKLL